ncbi:hypothetical protein [Methylotenera mobilis]|jgi:hypothetical protein|uniref:hypothetical protein n=1 Tax=Methylotenera mobilis TaxID=359408 RepID=UPI00037CB9FA|nr:hypothetical protein [Methylotenera mobilis]PPC97010.1 MAG: hypothetical protein CTY32_03325 [Methylotenera sp.]
MKHLKQIVTATTLALGLSLSMAALAYTDIPEEMIPEDSAEPDMSAVTPVTVGEVTYLSGGIGRAESVAMRQNAKNYPLEIVFVEKAGTLEEYLSEVTLQIQDVSKNNVLEIATEGPYFLANLPQGKYFVSAEYKGEVKTQWVNVSKKKHAKLVFWWRTQ